MNSALLDDLKQFIDTRLSQFEIRMDERFEAVDARFEAVDSRFEKLEKKFDDGFDTLSGEIGGLRQEMREGFAGVADAMDETNKANDNQFARLKKRVGIA
jgi:hypothetical protein